MSVKAAIRRADGANPFFTRIAASQQAVDDAGVAVASVPMPVRLLQLLLLLQP